MGKNKKKHSGGSLIPVPLAVLFIVVSSLGLCYLWLYNRCDSIGEELKALEVH